MPWSKIMKPDSLEDQQISAFSLKEVSPREREAVKIVPGDIGGRLSAIEREAYERGFAAGERAGEELGLKKVDATHQIFIRLVEEFKDFKKDLLKEAEGDILKIAMALARRVIGQEVSQNPESVMGRLREIIAKIGQTDTLLIRMHPQDMEKITKEQARLIQSTQEIKWLRFEPDGNLLPGECVVESHERMVDARFESRLSIIEQAIEKPAGKG